MMNDLISRAVLINDLSYCAPELFFDKDYLIAKVMKQPAVDQELLGSNILFHEQYAYCPNCGRAVKWE